MLDSKQKLSPLALILSTPAIAAIAAMAACMLVASCESTQNSRTMRSSPQPTFAPPSGDSMTAGYGYILRYRFPDDDPYQLLSAADKEDLYLEINWAIEEQFTDGFPATSIRSGMPNVEEAWNALQDFLTANSVSLIVASHLDMTYTRHGGRRYCTNYFNVFSDEDAGEYWIHDHLISDVRVHFKIGVITEYVE